MNHKKVYRLYREAGLAVRKRKRRKGVMVERQPLVLPDAPNHTWSMDFVMDSLANGRRIKCLTIVDDFTKECLDIPVAMTPLSFLLTRRGNSILPRILIQCFPEQAMYYDRASYLS